MDKLKDLENTIQAYADSNPESNVVLEINRDIDFCEGKAFESARRWIVTVTHEPKELP